MSSVFDIVDDGEERADINTRIAAGDTHCLVAKTKFDAKAANDL